MASSTNEKQRLEDLHSYRIMDTLPEQSFDDIVLIASHIFKTPIALISLVDDQRQWFKAKVGLEANQTPRDIAFCSHAIYETNTFVVEDALKDSRFSNNPLVTGNPHIRFYAGSQLKTKDGNILGTLCVIDQNPRHFTTHDKNVLNALSRQVMSQLELKKSNLKLIKSSEEFSRLETCLNALNIGFWEWDLTNNILIWDQSMYRLYGMKQEDFSGAYDAWEKSLHEEDKSRVTQLVQKSIEGNDKFNTTFRVKSGSQGIRHIAAQGEVILSESKKPLRMIGVNWDISKDTEKEEFLKGVFETSFQPIITCDIHGTFTRVNKAFAELLSFPIEGIVGRNIRDYVSEKELSLYLEKLAEKAASLDQSILTFETSYRTASGQNVPVLIRSQLIVNIDQKPSYFLSFVNNLTEQKKVEKSLAQSEEFFRKLFDFAPVGMILRDQNLRFLRVNKSYQKIVGYSESELLKMTSIEITHPEHTKDSIATIQEIYKFEEIGTVEKRKITKNKNEIWVKSTSALLKTPHGEAVLSIVEDVTFAKEAGIKIKEAHDQLNVLFNSMREGLVLQTKSGQIFKSNPACLEILGLSHDELMGRTSIDPRWQSIKEDGTPFPGTEHPAMMALATGKPYFGVPMGIKKKDGSTTWISINAVPLFMSDDHEPYQVIVTFSDITEIRTAQNNLKETNKLISLEKRKFENFVFALNESAIVAMTDTKGRITFANEKFCKISGYTLEELLGKDHRILNSGVHNRDFFNHLWQTISSGQVWCGEICNKTKDGSLYWVESTIVPLLNDLGKPNQYIAIRFDTTKRKQLEEFLVESRELERKANSAKSEFLSNMSHEIRTPLNGVIGMTDILRDSGLNEEQKGYTDSIVNSGKLLLDIINDILDFSKIESGHMELENIDTDLNSLFKELIVPHQFKCKSKGIDLQLSIPFLSYKVIVDPIRISQVINNLLSNAIKFTNFGSVCFIVDLTLENPTHVTISVKVHDSGIGIPLEQQSKLFKAFSQAETSTSRKFGGTGLGLSIVKKLIELMGGTIEFESLPGKGSTFKIQLTIKKSLLSNEEQNVSTDKKRAQNLGKKLNGHILVAEDNVINQNIVLKILKDLGCTTELAQNGQEALEKIHQQKFDLVLMDCRMPLMDGYEATRKIRADKSHGQSNILIIALTANASEDDRKRCLEAGMNDFISKPIVKEKLFLSLSAHLKIVDKINDKYNDNDDETMNKANKEIDITFINELWAMNTPDDPNFFDEQITTFKFHSTEIINKINISIQSNDRKSVSELAHSLKGSVANFGAVGIARLCGLIEENAGTLDTSELSKIAKKIHKEIILFYAYLEEMTFKKSS